MLPLPHQIVGRIFWSQNQPIHGDLSPTTAGFSNFSLPDRVGELNQLGVGGKNGGNSDAKQSYKKDVKSRSGNLCKIIWFCLQSI